MREMPDDGPEQSLMPVHPPQKVDMCLHAVQLSKEHRPRSRALFARLLVYMRKVLSVVLTGFIFLLKAGMKAYQHNVPEQSVQELNLELKQKNQELEEATQVEDKFISMASHELKTPMTAITGHTQLMLRRLSRLPEISSELNFIRAALERINGQTHRLNALVDELLDLNNLRTGKLDLKIRAFNLIGLCREVVEDQQLLTGRTIGLDMAQVPIILQADYERLSQVLVNLLNNALKYSPEGAPVKVTVERSDYDALMQVSDIGPGIPKDQQARIFEAFYRSPDVQFSSKSGLGLGLTICKEIVERHHGRIWCDSTEGEGSAFFVEVPLRQY